MVPNSGNRLVLNRGNSAESAVAIELGLSEISYHSPIQMVLTGSAVALTIAVILSGGELRILGQTIHVKLPPLGTGIAKLREAFGQKAEPAPRRPRKKKG